MTAIINITTIITILLACIMGAATPAMQRQVNDKFESMATWIDIDQVELGAHPIERRGEKVTADVRSLIKNCPTNSQRVYRGINKYDGYYLFACLLEHGKVALIVVVPAIVKGSTAWREVTDFISRSQTYLAGLVQNAKYAVQP